MPGMIMRLTWIERSFRVTSDAIVWMSLKLISGTSNGQILPASSSGRKMRALRWKKQSSKFNTSRLCCPKGKTGVPLPLGVFLTQLQLHEHHLPRSNSGSAGEGSTGRSESLSLRSGYCGLRGRVQSNEESRQRIPRTSARLADQ